MLNGFNVHIVIEATRHPSNTRVSRISPNELHRSAWRDDHQTIFNTQVAWGGRFVLVVVIVVMADYLHEYTLLLLALVLRVHPEQFLTGLLRG